MESSSTIKKLSVFISSPSDVKVERLIIARVIERLNKLEHISRSFILHPLAYEIDAPPVIGELDGAQGIINKYMLKPGQADIFICILWSRIGTPLVVEGTSYKSGTEYEFLEAYRANQEFGRPIVFLYRSLKPLNPNVDTLQLQLVQDFFSQFDMPQGSVQGLYKTFSTDTEFEDILLHDLNNVLVKQFHLSSGLLIVDKKVLLLPHRFDDFVNRETYLFQAIEGLKARKPVQLRGLGGIGKTRLAIEIAYKCQNLFSNGVIWLSILDYPTSDGLLNALASALGIEAGALPLPEKKIFLKRALAEIDALIILDNVEEAQSASDLAQVLTHGTLLCTSRPPLLLPNFELLEVKVLDIIYAVKLFETLYGKQMSSNELQMIKQVCGDVLEGYPLAIELAAKQAKVQNISILKLAERINRHTLDVLDVAYLGSIRAPLLSTWESLNAEDQVVFAALGVFAGRSFTEDAINSVVQQATEENLLRLAAYSLIQIENDRYSLHPLIKQFAAEKISSPDTFQRMATYFINFLQQHHGDISALEIERANIFGAVEWAYKNEQKSLFLSLIEALLGEDPYYSFWAVKGYWDEGVRRLSEALTVSTSTNNDTSSASYSLALGLFYYWLGNHESSRRAYLTAERIFGRNRNKLGLIRVYWQRGYIEDDEDNYRLAYNLYSKSLKLAKHLRDPKLISTSKELVGVVEYHRGRYFHARRLITESLQECIARNDVTGVSRSQRRLAAVARAQAMHSNGSQALDFAQEARHLIIECLAHEKNERSRARALRQMGMLDLYEGIILSAQQHLSESLDIFQRLGNRKGVASTLYLLGIVAEKAGHLETAEQLCLQSLSIGEAIKVRMGVALNLRELGIIEHKMNHRKKAIAYLEDAIKLLKIIHSPYLGESKALLRKLKEGENL